MFEYIDNNKTKDFLGILTHLLYISHVLNGIHLNLQLVI
jgi:hypothetical protein